MALTVVGAAGAVALATLLGVSDAPNGSAALLAARTGSLAAVAVWCVGWHLIGGLVAGVAVARTVVGMVHVGRTSTTAVLAAACWTSVVFTGVTTRRGLPTSASVGLVGGLAGAGMAAGGARAVDWGGVHGDRVAGVVGVLVGVVVAPVLAAAVSWVVALGARRLAFVLPRRAGREVHGGLWLSSALVSVADGTNDGQKAMGVLAVVVAGSGTLGPSGYTRWEQVTCAAVLAVATAVGGRRIVARVSRGLSKGGAVDDLAAQCTSATVILVGAAVGLPLSTSTVVTSAMVGSGLAARRRHVRWRGVVTILGTWLATVPVCAVLAAAAFELLRLVP